MNIYSITNTVNGKVYIGQTSGPPMIRWKDHLSKAKRGVKSILYYAMKKYGPDNFRFDVIASALPGCLDELEILLIAQHKSYVHDPDSNGYNQTRGGKGWSSDVVKHMAKSRDLSNYSASAKARAMRMSAEGTHNFQGEQGSKRASAQNHQRVADGTHPAFKELSCPHCPKVGRGPNMYRWHFANCTNREKIPQH